MSEQITGDHGGVAYLQLREPHTYLRHPPCISNASSNTEEKLANFYTMISQREIACPGEGYYHFDECHIYGSAHILCKSGWFEPSTVDWLPPPERPRLEAMNHTVVPSELGDTVPTVVICKAGYNNHGHVIAEILPKLVNLHRSGLKRIKIVLSPDMAKFFSLISDILSYLGIFFETVHVAADQVINARNVVFFSAVSKHDARKSQTLAEFVEVVYAVTRTRPARERKVFVDRDAHEARHIVNRSGVHEIFRSRGYAIMHPGDMAVEEQIALFSTASHVAGPLGAGLANIAFAPPGCEVVMIDPGLVDYFFWDLSCVRDQRFFWYLARRIDGWSPALSVASFQVNEAHLRAVLEMHDL